jgi:hypothetical protein
MPLRWVALGTRINELAVVEYSINAISAEWNWDERAEYLGPRSLERLSRNAGAIGCIGILHSIGRVTAFSSRDKLKVRAGAGYYEIRSPQKAKAQLECIESKKRKWKV